MSELDKFKKWFAEEYPEYDVVPDNGYMYSIMWLGWLARSKIDVDSES